MKVTIVDNYDSFTFNLKHYFELFSDDVTVVRNDDSELWSHLEKSDKIVLSPGPGLPKETTNLNKIIARFYKTTPLLGVCLGHQAIAQFFGEPIVNLKQVLHGKSTVMRILTEDSLFFDLPKEFQVARYHSWSMNNSKKSSNELIVTARDEQGYPLAIKHTTHNVRGVQFHPESILTEHGKALIKNWITRC